MFNLLELEAALYSELSSASAIMARLLNIMQLLLYLLGAACAFHIRHKNQHVFPGLPFITDGPKIVDASGATLKYAGTNWPGHGPVMVPEGLQYQSIKTIVSDIKGLGMNVIRLTYAIQMIDEIYNNGQEDIDLQTAFSQGLGEENGTMVLEAVLANNPQFTVSTKRLEVRGDDCECPL